MGFKLIDSSGAPMVGTGDHMLCGLQRFNEELLSKPGDTVVKLLIGLSV